jgi:rRNA maturation endonuclease Nob1
MVDWTIPRCLRCATLLRNNRKVCPSCGLGADGKEVVTESAVAEAPAAPVRAVKARRDMKICPVCSSSVTEADLTEYEGQLVCSSCGSAMRAKAQKRQAGSPAAE